MFNDLIHVYCKNPASALVFAVAFIITTLLLLGLAYGLAEFLVQQVVSLFRLYFYPPRDTSRFHPYTRALLRNSAPELARLRTLGSLKQTAEVRLERERLVQNIFYLLEAHEPDPIKDEIISQLRRAAK